MHRRRTPLVSTLVALLAQALVLTGSVGATAQAAPQAVPAPRAEPGSPDIGGWSVSPAGAGIWAVSWTSPTRLPITSDRPTVVTDVPAAGVPAGTALGVATVAADGRTVRTTVVSAAAPDPDDLDVVLSGRTLDERRETAPPATGRAERWSPPIRELLAADPGVPGDLPVVTSDYELPGVRMEGMPRAVEMIGHVVEPAPEVADPSHPLVLFLHGRHAWCYNPKTGNLGWDWPCRRWQEPVPSQLGYHYVQRVLASQGYVTVSIAANGINAQDDALLDAGAGARARLIQEHLAQWRQWSRNGTHQVDLENVVLVGHSRGGEGVSRASLQIPVDAPYRVVGQVLIGPTNFARQTTPYVPTVTVLPSCDGDVSDLQGQSFTDLSRRLATGDTAMKSSLMVIGANHNYFNTEWTPRISAAPSNDDWYGDGGACGVGSPTRLTAAQQRQVGRAYVAGAVHLFADGDEAVRPMFDGSLVRVGSAGAGVVLSHMLGGGRDLRIPGVDAEPVAPAGAETKLCLGLTPWDGRAPAQCGRFVKQPESTPHWGIRGSLAPTTRAFEMGWDNADEVGGLTFAEPLDLGTADYLDLRTIVDPTLGDASLQVRVTDTTGATAQAVPAGGQLLPALPRGPRSYPGKHWAQTLRVGTADLTGIDLSSVERVELVGTSDRGRVWVLDLASVSASLPAVPFERVPMVDLGQLRVTEGGPGTHRAELPFTVTGDVTRVGEVVVYGFNTATEETRRLELEITPGTTTGTIGWDFTGDDLDSPRRTYHELVGHAVRDVMMRDNQGRIVVLDDDPSPEVTFRAVRPLAPEGGDAVFEATLSAPVSYDLDVAMIVARGDSPAPPVRVHDIGPRWLRQWTWYDHGADPPLHRVEAAQWASLRAGETSVRFRVPIRDDDRVEPRESLAMRLAIELLRRPTPAVTVHVPRGR